MPNLRSHAARIPPRIRAARAWRIARWALVFPLLYLLWLFLRTSQARLYYPFELEWFEGHLAVQAWRVAQGLPQYPGINSGWVTYSYPPVFFWVAGAMMRLFGFSLVWGRIISLASTFLAALGAGMIIYDATRKRLAAALGGLLLFAYYKPSGFWFDLFRVDMLTQAILAWGAYLALKRRRAPWQEILGLALLVLAPLTKQTVAPVSIVVIAIAIIRHWRITRYALAGALILTVNTAAMLRTSNPPWKQAVERYWQYLVENPRRHVFYWNRVHPEGVRHEMLAHDFTSAPAATVRDYAGRFSAKPPEAWGAFYRYLLLPAAVVGLWIFLSIVRLRAPRGGLWLLFAAFLLYGSLASWAMIGGFSNNFIPGFCAAAIVFGLAVGGIERLLTRRWMRVYFDVFLGAGLVLQIFGGPAVWQAVRRPFLRAPDPANPASMAARYAPRPEPWLAYRPADQQPEPGSIERGLAILEWVRKHKGEVYVPHHTYLMVLAGDEPFYTIDAARDWNYAGQSTPETLLAAIRAKKYRYILMDGELAYEWLPGGMDAALRENYHRSGPVVEFKGWNELMPVTGAKMRPYIIFERN